MRMDPQEIETKKPPMAVPSSVLVTLLVISLIGNAVLWYGGSTKGAKLTIMEPKTKTDLLKDVTVTSTEYSTVLGPTFEIYCGVPRNMMAGDDARAYFVDRAGVTQFSVPIESPEGRKLLDLFHPAAVDPGR